MYLYFSKIMRISKNIKTPNCYAFTYLPESLKTVCDCTNICKYDPNNGRNTYMFETNHDMMEQRKKLRL